MADLVNALKQNSTVSNSKGGKYYFTSYDANLDFFSGVNRYTSKENIENAFACAFTENRDLALANLLYVLDVRGGKGERNIFKTAFTWLCVNHPDAAIEIIPFIPEYGRWDYILCGIGTPVEENVLDIIRSQLDKDLISDNPSLLGKWLPSVRTHGKNNPQAANLAKLLGMSQKKYRKALSYLRLKINLVEKNLTEKKYDAIDFEAVPTKAMLKYRNAFANHMKDEYDEYRASVVKGEKKINTSGLFCYEIVKKIENSMYLSSSAEEEELYDLMWKNQKDFLEGNKTNVLVMSDTSGSMRCYNGLPLANSLGLATYIAERNHGYFHNHFMTFSSLPQLVELKGNTITEKLHSFRTIVENTDIDLAFMLLRKTCVSNHISQEDMPSHIIIISDMEFDMGCMSKNGTNFQGWKKAYEDAGYKLPTIIFWNVAGAPKGFPVTKFDNDVCMVSGFSTSLLESILTLDEYTPVTAMLEVLKKYLNVLA